MSKKNSKPNEEMLENLEVEQTEEKVEEAVEEAIVEAVSESVPEVLYTINNCKKLNIRKKPNTNSDVLCVATSANTLKIEEIKNKPEWVKVVTDGGVEGYCMKQFVAVK